MSRVLVTGGTSFMLAPLVRRLAYAGHSVKVLSRNAQDRARRLEGVRCQVVIGDVRDAGAVSHAMLGCQEVVHGAYAEVSCGPRTIMDTAVLGTANVLRACELHHVEDLMLISSPWAEGRTYYGVGKLASEMMTSAWEVDGVLRRAVIARVFNPYGPDMGSDHVIPQFTLRMLALMKEHPGTVISFPVSGSGLSVRSFTYITDVADQLFALSQDGRPGLHDVGWADDPRSVTDVAFSVAEILGGRIKVDARDGLGQVVSDVRAHPRLTAPPRVGFQQGLAKTVQWYREHQEEFSGRPL